MDHLFKRGPSFAPAFKIALIYFIISTIWIFTSDKVLYGLVGDTTSLTYFQSLKGWFFITVTAALIFYLTRTQLKKAIEVQDQYCFVFEKLPVSLWEQDLSAIVAWLNGLPVKNGAELRKFLDQNPHELLNGLSKIKILRVNQETVHLYGAKDVSHLLENFNYTMSEESLQTFKEVLIAVYEKKSNVEYESIGRKIDGTRFNFLIKFNIPPLGSNQPLVVAIVDITKQKMVEAEIEHAKRLAQDAAKAKSEFLAIMSHEIRTPINVICGMIEVISDQGMGSAETPKLLSVLQKNAKSLLGILSSMIDLSRIESGKIIINKENIKLTEILESIHATCDFFATDKGLQFKITAQDSIPEIIYTDRIRLEQILTNLAINAIKFTESGSVTIDVSGNHSLLIFSVTDTGIGMNEKDLSKIFEMFTQGDSTHTRKYGGSGIGLTIAKELTTLLGSKLEVESKEGVGTKFTLKIPLEKRAHFKIEPSSIKEILAGKSLLIVDDKPDNLYLLEMLLSHGSCEITRAENGMIAYESYLSKKFDLILMDIQMPVMDGISATTKIREFETKNNKKRTPIIFVSAYALDTNVSNAINAGGDAFLPKPLNKKALFEKINEVLLT